MNRNNSKSLMQLGVAVRQFERALSKEIDALMQYGSCMVHDAQQRTGSLDSAIRPIQSGVRIAGSAVTVLCPVGDNWMVPVALELCQPGDLLLIATTQTHSDAVMGGLLATAAKERGVQGVVTEAGVRDVSELKALNFPAWSRHISPRGSVKQDLGSVNIPVICAGQLVHPGDILVADDDGVVVVPRLSLPDVLAACAQRQQAEAAKLARLKKGELTLDIDGMRPALKQAGLRYLQRAEITD